MIEALIGVSAAALLTLGGAIYSYGRLTTKVSQLCLLMTNHLDHHLKRVEPDINDIKKDIAVIKAREE